METGMCTQISPDARVDRSGPHVVLFRQVRMGGPHTSREYDVTAARALIRRNAESGQQQQSARPAGQEPGRAARRGRSAGCALLVYK